MGKMISVLLPTCDRPQSAIKAIKSALLQTYKTIEVIVVDNSKNDDLRSLIEAVGDNRVRYFRNEYNIGAINNWKKCLSLATGDYCVLLPDDDYFINPFYLEDAANIIKEYQVGLGNTDCLMDYGSSFVIGESKNQGLVNGYDFFYNKGHIPHISNIFSRKLAVELQAFSDEYILWSDIELWYKLFAETAVYFYHKPSVMYCFHGENIVTTMTLEMLIRNSVFISRSIGSKFSNKIVENVLIDYLYSIDLLTEGMVDKKVISKILVLNSRDMNLMSIQLRLLPRIMLQRFRMRLAQIRGRRK
jgi:glycosyltransferase involved in cell wall biosynthesis